MRLRNLFEYSSIEQAKSDVINTINGLDPSDEKGAELIDRIFRALNSEETGGKIEKAFGPPMADERMSDDAKLQHIAKVAKIISTVDSDFAGMNKFLTALESGKALNVGALKSTVTSFNELCNGDNITVKVLNSLMGYGAGIKRKGPGEFALAMMSPNIRLADGQGDLEIDGLGHVELKTETTSGGGRMGMGGPTRESQVAVLEKYQESAPELIEDLMGRKSITLMPLMKLLNQHLPLTGQGNQAIRVAFCKDMFALTFGDNYGSAMAQGFGQQDPRKAQMEFVKYNFEWYKEKDNFSTFIVMNVPLQKILRASTGDELLELYSSGHLQGGGAAFIHTGQASEVYAQMKTSANKA
jgi:hypothetical protein|tara:strand:+ start:489 stop:1553 length:1065 start_codon:yes stop_codon:yes gene_type:complete